MPQLSEISAFRKKESQQIFNYFFYYSLFGKDTCLTKSVLNSSLIVIIKVFITKGYIPLKIQRNFITFYQFIISRKEQLLLQLNRKPNSERILRKMKAPTYILKRVYLERNLQREQKSHQQRLEEIKNLSPKKSVFKKVSQMKSMQDLSKKHHAQSKKFQLKEELFLEILNTKKPSISIAPISVTNSTVNMSKMNLSTMPHSLISTGMQLEQQRIQRENELLAKRIMELPPVISKQDQIEQYKELKDLGNQIQRFHYLKPQIEQKYDRMERKELDQSIEVDTTNEELMNMRVQTVVMLQEISFINFLPVNCEEEQYFLEIKASVRAMRRTEPEMYNDFAKSVINEFFYLKELVQNQQMYIGLFQVIKDQERFLGDFELDLGPYYDDNQQHEIHYDLRNYKELMLLPNYMPKDMRQKGWIDFKLKVQSSIQQYLFDMEAKKDQNNLLNNNNPTNQTQTEKQ